MAPLDFSAREVLSPSTSRSTEDVRAGADITAESINTLNVDELFRTANKLLRMSFDVINDAQYLVRDYIQATNRTLDLFFFGFQELCLRPLDDLQNGLQKKNNEPEKEPPIDVKQAIDLILGDEHARISEKYKHRIEPYLERAAAVSGLAKPLNEAWDKRTEAYINLDGCISNEVRKNIGVVSHADPAITGALRAACADFVVADRAYRQVMTNVLDAMTKAEPAYAAHAGALKAGVSAPVCG